MNRKKKERKTPQDRKENERGVENTESVTRVLK